MSEPTTLQMILPFLLVIAMLATAGVLVYGVITMLRASKTSDAHKSNKLMQYRVMLQAVALMIFMLLLALKK